MNCSTCGAPNPEGSAFCLSCGARLTAEAGSLGEGGTAQIPRKLHAMRAGDILDETIRLYRTNFRTFVGIVAFLQLPLIILQLVQQAILGSTFPGMASPFAIGQVETGMVIFWVASSVVILIATVIFYNLLQAALASTISQRYLGNSSSVRGAYRVARSCFWRLLGSTWLVGIIVMLVAIIATGIPFALVSIVKSNYAWFSLVIPIVGIPYAMFMALRWAFIGQAVVLENVGVRRSLSRSWGLVKGTWWRVFGILLIAGLLQSLVSGIPAGVIGMAVLVIATIVPPDAQLVVSIIGSLLGSIFGILAAPLLPTVTTLLYYDLRIRKEGFDLQLLADRAGRGHSPAVGS